MAMEQYYGTGRRKTAVARVFLRPGEGKIVVNGKEFQSYFRGVFRAVQALAAFRETGTAGRYDAVIRSSAVARPVRRRDQARHRPRAAEGQPRLPRADEAQGPADPRPPRSRTQEVRPQEGAPRASVQQALNPARVPRTPHTWWGVFVTARLGTGGYTGGHDAFLPITDCP